MTDERLIGQKSSFSMLPSDLHMMPPPFPCLYFNDHEIWHRYETCCVLHSGSKNVCDVTTIT